MAHIALQMNALAVSEDEKCAGCNRPFRRAERMNAMEYSDGDHAGWHCDECVELWTTSGETALPRWSIDS